MAEIYQSLRTLLDNDEFADLEFHCGDKSFRLHRAIVCPQSQWFGNQCRRNVQSFHPCSFFLLL